MNNSKCNRCGKVAHHTHHKDWNHKNNKTKNLERLCTICHAKEHNEEPKITELKNLVITFNKVQKTRIAIELSIKSFSRIDLDIPDGLRKQLKSLVELEEKSEKDISGFFKKDSDNLYRWLVSIRGIGDLMAAKILSQIDFQNTPKVSSLWKYAGFAPDSKRVRGKSNNYNQTLKVFCYQLASGFIRARTIKYREVYDKEKLKQLDKGIKKLHAHNRAIRKMIKVFLRDLFLYQRGNDHSISVFLTNIKVSSPLIYE